jgi:secreted trypsin-like serine protease
VNGYVCDEDSSPVVPLLLNTDEEPNFGVCSGSIIQSSPMIILTAAHCLFPSSSATISSVTVIIGGESFSTTALTPHPEYTPEVTSSYVDIAILEFDSTTTIPPLRGLSDTEEMKSPIRHVAAGYGNTTPGIPPSGLDGALRATDIRVIESSESAVISDTTSKTGGICTGDSGGPLLIALESGEWRIVGVSSYLLRPTFDSPLCAADNINVYASTTFTEHLTFIKQFVPDFTVK